MRHMRWLKGLHILHKFDAYIMGREMFTELSVINIFISSQRDQLMQ